MGCHEVMMIGSIMTVKVQAAVSLNKFKKYVIMTSLQMA